MKIFIIPPPEMARMARNHLILQNITLAAALAAMIGLVYLKKEPLALLAMIALSVGALMYGRVFCGYLCPFHTFDKVYTGTIGKVTSNRIPFPKGAVGSFVSIIIALVLLAIVILKAAMPYTKFKVAIPVLVVAFVVLVLFERRVWHRYLCPFGLIMRCPAYKRVAVPHIDQNA